MKSFLIAALLAGTATLAAAAPASYSLETQHTYPSFEAPHLGVSWWRGKFLKSSGKVVLDKEGKTGNVDITVDTSSIDFGHEKMNTHAKSPDFFNVAEFPTASYKGKLVFTGDVPTSVDGQLTLLGVTKPVTMQIVEFKCIMHPFFKKEDCGGDAYAEFNRADFGMTKYADGPLGKVRLRVQVEAIKD